MGKTIAPCARCRLLQKPRRLDHARKYQRLAARLDEALAMRILMPDPVEPWDRSAQPPIRYTTMRKRERAGKGVPDLICYYFRCKACGRRFRLSCNFYHGRGGEWKTVT